MATYLCAEGSALSLARKIAFSAARRQVAWWLRHDMKMQVPLQEVKLGRSAASDLLPVTLRRGPKARLRKLFDAAAASMRPQLDATLDGIGVRVLWDGAPEVKDKHVDMDDCLPFATDLRLDDRPLVAVVFESPQWPAIQIADGLQPADPGTRSWPCWYVFRRDSPSVSKAIKEGPTNLNYKPLFAALKAAAPLSNALKPLIEKDGKAQAKFGCHATATKEEVEAFFEGSGYRVLSVTDLEDMERSYCLSEPDETSSKRWSFSVADVTSPLLENNPIRVLDKLDVLSPGDGFSQKMLLARRLSDSAIRARVPAAFVSMFVGHMRAEGYPVPFDASDAQPNAREPLKTHRDGQVLVVDSDYEGQARLAFTAPNGRVLWSSSPALALFCPEFVDERLRLGAARAWASLQAGTPSFYSAWWGGDRDVGDSWLRRCVTFDAATVRKLSEHTSVSELLWADAANPSRAGAVEDGLWNGSALPSRLRLAHPVLASAGAFPKHPQMEVAVYELPAQGREAVAVDPLYFGGSAKTPMDNVIDAMIQRGWSRVSEVPSGVREKLSSHQSNGAFLALHAEPAEVVVYCDDDHGGATLMVFEHGTDWTVPIALGAVDAQLYSEAVRALDDSYVNDTKGNRLDHPNFHDGF